MATWPRWYLRQKPVGGGVRQVVSQPFPFPPLPLSIPPKFSDTPVGRKVRSSEGEVPRLPPYKYHPGQEWHPTCKKLGVGVTI